VNFNNISVCVGGQYSGGIFTVKTAGYYYFYSFAISSNSDLWLKFRKNNTDYAGGGPYTNTNYTCVSGNVIAYMDEGDTMNMYVNTGIFYGQGNIHNGFGGYYLSS